MAADASGNWSLTLAAPLADGPHTSLAAASDAAGNMSPNSNTVTFTVDTTAPAAPVITAPANGSTTNDSTPTISGTAEVNSTVSVKVDGTAVGTVAADASGNWSFTLAAALTDGPHASIATAADALGNISPNSTPVTFTVDTTAPAAPVVTVPVDGSTTNDSTPTISGTAEANSAVSVKVDGAAVGTVAADGTGSWLITLVAPLADGLHSSNATAADAAGNMSPVSAPVTFTVDVAAPAAPVITNPANGSVTNDSTPTISGTAEANSVVTVKVDGAAVGTPAADGTGNWVFTLVAPLADGPHTAIAAAADAVGNPSANSNSITFTVDTTAPGVPVITVPANGSATNDSTPAISGTAEANSVVTVKVDGVAAGTSTADGTGSWLFTPVTPLAGGPHTAAAAAADAVGNVSADSNTVSFTVTIPVSSSDDDSSSSSSSSSSPAAPASEEKPALIRLSAAAGGKELALTPVFSQTIYVYRAEVNEEEAEIRGERSSASLTFKLNGEEWNGISKVKLTEGHNIFAIELSSPGGLKQTYTLNLHRNVIRPGNGNGCPFIDLIGHWSESEVCEAYTHQIVQGYDAAHFVPDNKITRAEFVTLLLRVHIVDTQALSAGVPVFKDQELLPEWSKEAVHKGTAVGIIEGYPDGAFRPNNEISRAEMAVLLSKSFQWKAEPGPTIFKDDAAIPEWARSEVKAANTQNVLNGRAGGNFAADGQATRAEAAVALLRVWKELHKTDAPQP
ncbi:hypothetical protein CF651_04570 [Paenibacillus rigui]|uniref:SLH domain-containing protein n=1 Tax=Paenibacillus rigui TaxID=554312 RepID=A0A229UWF7_9BACL|nr:hypothetical protein CF651_04570 [Paenibacillus rigui]